MLFDACFKAIDKNPLAMTRGNESLTLDYEYEGSTPEVMSRFYGLKTCELSVAEVLALCYLGEYLRERFYKGLNYTYSVSVQIEKNVQRDDDLKEWYFGDGMIRWENAEGSWGALPVQETKAINYTVHTAHRIIEDEIIKVINKKTLSAVRKKYNSVCGLVVSVMPKHSNIDYRRILAAINISNYSAVYLIEYSNSFKTGTVIDLLSYKNSEPIKPLSITPQLKRIN
ncbi:MAG: hypothetical protein ACREGD_01885 [Candidatus Saccharimonadales bacterium]